ncbi:MAG: methylenetetrahydrofolate reductase [Pseudomonadota bacterium]
MPLNTKLDAGDFVVLAEMEPPKGVDVSAMVNNATRVKGMVDAFIVPEMSNAVMRMSALGGAMILQSKGMPTVMQVNCRDRNRLALQADLLAAGACGVENVMAVTGEDTSYGDHHQARTVNDIDLPELLKVIAGLKQGKDMAGIELSGAPSFLVGSTCQFGAVGKSPELEIEALNQKMAAGASFFITPPLFDVSAMEPYMMKLKASQPAIIPTVLLLKSLGMARYMARNMSHIRIPERFIERIQGAGDKVRECIQITAEVITSIKRAGYPGVMLATLGWENRLADILERVQR